MQKLFLLAGLFLSIAWLGATERLVCLYNSISDQRRGIGHFEIGDIKPFLCTHIIYSFVGIDSKWGISVGSSDKIKFPLFKDLKKRDPAMKTLLEVNLISSPFVQEMLSMQGNRRVFINSALSLLRNPDYTFDGINLLWLESRQRGDKKLFTNLIQEFRRAINLEAAKRGYEKLLLTASVSAQPLVISRSYEVKLIAEHIDFFNVMTSDVEIPFVKGKPSFYTTGDSFSKAASAVNFWNKQGVPTQKINMGIGVFGEAFTINSLGIVNPAGGNVPDIPEGFLARYEVCSFLQGLLMAASDKQVVFDDIASIDAKASYIKQHKYGGAFVMSLDLDDFNQQCCSHPSKYPVIQHLHDELVLKFVIG
ncbi:acidic mammalian chitinase-like [Corythoichthys intestinalis]|uniref:acidic mammalian chitinase-like n=1 Tax=Corythoichthys intestinalis TaxID=161448 RepID=UPI0025A639FE|nr:acidic mammalian chitinase-like [Corythoichthys intestinalis]